VRWRCLRGNGLVSEEGGEETACGEQRGGQALLDDPMSAVDTQTERLLVESLRPAVAGRTVLVATQRLSTIGVADRAVVIEDGRVVEQGRPAELLAAGGLFTALFGDESAAA
jgi:ABC-type multidrug transport system fused ATPase/permease subunit